MAESERAGVRILYGIDETADLMSVKRSTVYKLIASGDLERIKIGRRATVSAESIAKYISRCAASGRAFVAEGSDDA